MNEPIYNTAAVGSGAFFSQLTRSYLPALLQAARVQPGHRVLDVATGSGDRRTVGLGGGRGRFTGVCWRFARQNLRGLPVTLRPFDAHELSFADNSFDAVLCQLGLMFFDDPARALRSSFGSCGPEHMAAVSVNSTPERSLFLRVGVAISEHVPAKFEMFSRPFSIREPKRLAALFDIAGFQQSSVQSEIRKIGFASFEDYFSGIEKGATPSGQEYLLLPEDVRRGVREAVRRSLPQSSDGGPFQVEMELLMGSGLR